MTLKHGYMRYDLRQSSGMYTMLGSHRDWAGNSNIQKLILVTGSTREGMTRLSSPVMALSQSQSLWSHCDTLCSLATLGRFCWAGMAGDNPGCRCKKFSPEGVKTAEIPCWVFI